MENNPKFNNFLNWGGSSSNNIFEPVEILVLTYFDLFQIQSLLQRAGGLNQEFDWKMWNGTKLKTTFANSDKKWTVEDKKSLEISFQ